MPIQLSLLIRISLIYLIRLGLASYGFTDQTCDTEHVENILYCTLFRVDRIHIFLAML